jgi:hypothetical protein
MFEPNFDESTSNTFVTQFNCFKGFEILYSIYYIPNKGCDIHNVTSSDFEYTFFYLY